MKAKTRMLWMKLHAYFACFFLPLTFVYIVTGVLYMFDIHGEVSQEKEYQVPLTQGWPANEALAKPLVLKALASTEHPPLPGDYYFEQGNHDWYGHKQEVILVNTGDANTAKLVVKEHDVMLQLLIIHKGFAGWFLKLISVLFGLSLAFSAISGVVITLQLPQLKTPSMWLIGAGAAVVLVGFV